MPTAFLLIFIFAVVMLIVGLVKPRIFQKIIKKIPSRKNITLIFGGLIIFSFMMIGATAPKVDNKNTASESQSQVANEQNLSSSQGVVDTTNTADIVEKNTTIPSQGNPAAITENKNLAVKSLPAPIKTESVQSAPVASQPVISSPKTSTVLYSVSSVVDGDTIKVNINGKIETLRLIGLDTPETVDPRKEVQCFGLEASNKAKELLTGKKVKLEADSTQDERDKYGRLLRYVWLEDGTFYNKKMISDGYAHEYTYGVPYKYQAEFKAAQKSAQDNQRGLWATETCNGNTASVLASPSVATTTEPVAPAPAAQTARKYYTSSASNSTCYYPESCEAWKKLSSKNLKIFDSLDDLLKVYPTKTLCKTCGK